MKRALLATIMAFSCAAMAEDLRTEPIERDFGKFTERLLKAAPRGSTMHVPLEWVEERGFSCVPRENAEFSKEIPRGDFVLCSRETADHYYEVALFHTGRTFRNVAMSMRPVWMKPK